MWIILALVAMLLAPSVADAQTCPRHLDVGFSGWMPPSMCAGMGLDKLLNFETQAHRNMFQTQGIVAKTLVCWRTQLDDPVACLVDAVESYRTREGKNLAEFADVVPACYDSAGNLTAIQAWLQTVVYPMIYCVSNTVNTTRQKKVSQLLGALVNALARDQLERVRNEIKEDLLAVVEDTDSAAYIVGVLNMAEGAEPACLTTLKALELGALARAWMDANSHLAFCAH